jgi:hypothetical protein
MPFDGQRRDLHKRRNRLFGAEGSGDEVVGHWEVGPLRLRSSNGETRPTARFVSFISTTPHIRFNRFPIFLDLSEKRKRERHDGSPFRRGPSFRDLPTNGSAFGS